jgi:RHS repeat-associated protein
MKLRFSFSILLLTFLASVVVHAEQGDDNPTGVTGSFNGEITTGGMYDPNTGNAKRVVDDIVVPGSVGAYPLKWTRYFNSHLTYSDNKLGGAWRFSYLDYKHFASDNLCTPDGRRISTPVASAPLPDYGVEDYVDSPYPYTTRTLHMADGGQVVLSKLPVNGTTFYPQQIIDPYGQVTTLSWIVGGSSYKLDKVTEPGGRYLKINWDATYSYITSVQAFDGIVGHTSPMQSVTYTWTTQTLSLQNGGGHPNSYKVLTRADYSDGTFATYTYTEGNYPVPCSTPQGWFYTPMLATADDPHFSGPMKQIAYIYLTSGNKTRVMSENHLVSGQASEAVSTLSGLTGGSTQNATETRGDGQQRNFTYYKYPGVSDDNCSGREMPDPSPTDGKLQTYTDFQAHTTTLGYNGDGFIQSVADPNGNTTTYDRIGADWGITKVTHPDGSTIQQTFVNNQPYYLASRTDENNHRTDYTRDSNNRITRKDYPADSNGVREYETFAYNNLGQTLAHRARSGAYEYFKYDSRGLLTDKTNATWTYYAYDQNNLGNWPTNEPATHFDYYSAADTLVWTDRIKAQTDPRGIVTNYEYDRTLDANGENSGFSQAQTPVGGRGLVTRVSYPGDTHTGETPTYPTGTYQSCGFDQYANKLWEENELRQRRSYTYDDYRRVLTVKNPLNQTVTNTYTPTNGTNTSPYVHTTGSVYTTTTPTGIVTKNIYDPNFRKISVTEANGTAVAATTSFIYDVDPVRNYTSIGNLVAAQDPKGNRTAYVFDTRNRKITEIDAINQSTQWFYDNVSNVTSVQRKDNTTESKTYDQMNRVLTDTVPQTSTINVTTTFTYYPGNVQNGGLMKQVIDADGHITTFTDYDPAGLKTTVTYPNGDTHGFTYDNDKNLTARRTVNGTTQNLTYDARNRKIAMVWTNPTNVSDFTAEWANFTYEAGSRLTSAQNGIGAVGTGIISTITRQYDAAGQLLLDRQNLNSTLGNKDVQYAYDNDGRYTRLYLTSAGYDYTFSYDAMGRFEKIFNTGGSQLFQYKYDAASNEVERDNIATSVNQIYTRDALNRMSERDVKLNATVISSETYGFDPMSRITSTLREDGKTDAFTYYLDGELWSATYGNPNPTRTVTYNIDQMGNRTSVVDTGVTTTYTGVNPNNGDDTAAKLNQYYSVGGNVVGNGNEHQIELYQNIAYGYINDERLKSLDVTGKSYHLAYDALGRCVSRTFNNNTTYFIYDGEKPIVEYSSTGTVVARNLYGKGIDEILMRIDATLGTFYYQDDHEGSVTHLTSSTGTVLEKYKYDVFGAPTILDGGGNTLSASAKNNRFMFTGREYTSDFGVYEYRARAYHPGLGRFTGEDPKGFDAGDYNLFRYCHNDPEDLTDPMGTDTQEFRSGNNITWNVPVRFVGNLATPQNIKILTTAMEKGWSGTYGKYHVETRIKSSIKGYQTNVIAVDYGIYNPKTDENRSWANPGFKIGKDGLSAHFFFPGANDNKVYVAKHELGHGLKEHGLIDRYHDVKGDPNSHSNRGFENNIMGANLNGVPRARDIFTLVHNIPQSIQKLPGYGARANGNELARSSHITGAQHAEIARMSANPVASVTSVIGDPGTDSGNFSQMPPHIP